MRCSTSILIAAILFVLVSCKKEKEPSNENYIPVNRCQSFIVDEEILTVCLDSVVQDSRCPVNAVCIWQGVAVARFWVSVPDTNFSVTLAAGKDTSMAGFNMKFVNLLPQRELSKPFSYNEYVAEVKIIAP